MLASIEGGLDDAVEREKVTLLATSYITTYNSNEADLRYGPSAPAYNVQSPVSSLQSPVSSLESYHVAGVWVSYS